MVKLGLLYIILLTVAVSNNLLMMLNEDLMYGAENRLKTTEHK